MQVFKAFFKIVLKRISIPITYIAIFLVIAFMMTSQGTDSESKYTGSELSIGVIDNDESQASRRLIDFLSKSHEVTETEDDHDKILDSVYYEQTDYVLIINEGYMEKLENGGTDGLFSNYCKESSYAESLVKAQTDRYVSTVRSYLISGVSMDDALEKTQDIILDKTEVTLENFSDEENFFAGNIKYFFQYLPYIFIGILVSALAPTLLVLNRKEIRSRTNASCISTTSQTLQTWLGSIIYSVVIWIIFMAAAAVLSGPDIFSKEGLLAILNSFVFLIVALAIAMLVSVFLSNSEAANMAANTVGLGMSFLCGVFVPVEYLSGAVIKIAHFLPAYWFIRCNNMLAGEAGEVFSNSEFFMCIGVQLLFAAAMFSLVFLIAKTKRRDS
ncbi:MAG: ABC transporter permease [Porcipelethomonas sp.]